LDKLKKLHCFNIQFLELNHEKSTAKYTADYFDWTSIPPPAKPPTYYWNRSIGPQGPTEHVRLLKEPYEFIDQILKESLLEWYNSYQLSIIDMKTYIHFAGFPRVPMNMRRQSMKHSVLLIPKNSNRFEIYT